MVIFSNLILMAEVSDQTVLPSIPLPITTVLSPEALKSITHLWHTNLISDYSPLDRIGCETSRYFSFQDSLNQLSQSYEGSREKEKYPTWCKRNFWWGGGKSLLNYNLASNEILRANYQSIQGEHKGQSEVTDGLTIVISSVSRRSCITMQQERTLLTGHNWEWNMHLSGTSFLLNENKIQQ